MRNSSNDSDFYDVLDELSHDELDEAVESSQHQTSWQSAPTPCEVQDNTSPITPLISNRKVFNEGESSSSSLNKPPLEMKNESKVEFNEQVRAQAQDMSKLIVALKTIHLSEMGGDEGQSRQGREEIASEGREVLRCFGIEFDESLVGCAKSNIEKALSKYRHDSFFSDPMSLSERIFIRWGDILDEWDRDFNVDGSKSIEQLTLLNDATAVFVYLSPEGLKKIKPLLFEAALRRRRSQREMIETRRCDSVQQWKDLLKQQQYQQPEIVDELELLEEPIPLASITHHKGHQSRISDITNYDFDSRSDWDFTCRVHSESFDQGKESPAENFLVGSPATNMQSSISSLMTSASSIVSPFRVVTYLHPIPGWRATRTDRSSLGGCALYYYEDVDMQDC